MSNPMKAAFLSITLFPLLVSASPSIELPDIDSVDLQQVGKLKFKHIDESSGIVRSRLWPEIIWTHNDSNDKARIFGVDLEGNIVSPDWFKGTFKGIQIPDIVNIDWEDIATDDKGNLFIAACGNNGNARRDLAIYKVREPNPYEQILTRSYRTYNFEWPDQKEFPPNNLNFDCEALFYAHGKLYLLSKHRADTFTKLYRFDSLEEDQLNIPTLVDTFNIHGQVTGADYSNEHSMLAVITYTGVWTFEIEQGLDDFFNGQISWLPLDKSRTKRVEGICFVGEQLYISNEQRKLFALPIKDLIVLRKKHPAQ